jgi:putative endonuclease
VIGVQKTLRFAILALGPRDMIASISGAMSPQCPAAISSTFCASKRNGTLYVGVTNDLVRRMSEHKAKLVAGFTRKYGVDKLVYFEEYASILEARARERSLKRWLRVWKLDLIEKMNPEWRDLTHELPF